MPPAADGGRRSSPRAARLDALEDAPRPRADAALADAGAAAGADEDEPRGVEAPAPEATGHEAHRAHGAHAGAVASDRPLTPVKDSPEVGVGEAAPTRARLQHAAESAGHRLTLKREARGEVNDPALGRVAVSARVERGEVDVHVAAAMDDTRRALETRAPELVADVRAADIPVRHVTIAQGGASAWAGADLAGQHGGHADPGRDPGRDPADASSSGPRRPPAAARRPVRIVL